jgi:hypothetical protein
MADLVDGLSGPDNAIFAEDRQVRMRRLAGANNVARRAAAASCATDADVTDRIGG